MRGAVAGKAEEGNRRFDDCREISIRKGGQEDLYRSRYSLL